MFLAISTCLITISYCEIILFRHPPVQMDRSIRVWNIKEKRVANIWNNIVPKCNSFFTAKVYCAPSFQSESGNYLAYPHMKDVAIVERSSWKELFRLKCINIKSVSSIFKLSIEINEINILQCLYLQRRKLIFVNFPNAAR